MLRPQLVQDILHFQFFLPDNMARPLLVSGVDNNQEKKQTNAFLLLGKWKLSVAPIQFPSLMFKQVHS